MMLIFMLLRSVASSCLLTGLMADCFANVYFKCKHLHGKQRRLFQGIKFVATCAIESRLCNFRHLASPNPD